MALYKKLIDGDLYKLTEVEEAAKRSEWVTEGSDLPHSRKHKGKEIILSDAEVTEKLAEWVENDRPRTQQELDDVLEAEVQRDLNLSPEMKVILKQLFLLRKVNEPSLTQAVFFAELKADYKIFKG